MAKLRSSREALHKELVCQTAEGAALSFVFDQKIKIKKSQKGGKKPKLDA